MAYAVADRGAVEEVISAWLVALGATAHAEIAD